MIHVVNIAREAAGLAGKDKDHDSHGAHQPSPGTTLNPTTEAASASTREEQRKERRPRWRDRMIHFQEMHVHGPVALAEDVARLVVNTRHKKDSGVWDRVRAFEQNFGVPVAWMDEVKTTGAW